MPSVGDRLRQLRQELGLTQEALAAVVAASRGALSNWEHGVQPVPERYFAVLAQSLQVTEPYLRGGATAYVPPPIPMGRRLRYVPRPPELPPYEVKGSLEQMLSLCPAARQLCERTREIHPREMLRTVEIHWYRDAVHELLAAFHLMVLGASLRRGTLSQAGCPLLVIDHVKTWRNAGGSERDALVLERRGELLIAWPQVWLPLPRTNRCCRVDLLVLYARGSRTIWLDVEFDGSHHVDYFQSDVERAAALGLPRLGYANATVRQEGLGERILEDARFALERSGERKRRAG